MSLIIKGIQRKKQSASRVEAEKKQNFTKMGHRGNIRHEKDWKNGPIPIRSRQQLYEVLFFNTKSWKNWGLDYLLSKTGKYLLKCVLAVSLRKHWQSVHHNQLTHLNTRRKFFIQCVSFSLSLYYFQDTYILLHVGYPKALFTGVY